MAELGYQKGTSLTSWASLAAEAREINPDLVWPLSIEVYDRMRNEDSQVGSVLRAVTLPIRKARWVIDGEGCRDEVTNLVAGDLGLPVKGQVFRRPLRRRGRFSWEEHLRLALLELVYGHSFFEQVYRVQEDGRAHLAKLAWRPPRTICDIHVARDGGLEAIVQHGIELNWPYRRNDFGDIVIPVGRLVAYINEREGANWLGRSLLRQAYKNWLLKDRTLRAQAITVERNGVGIPKYTGAPVPDGADLEQRRAWEKSEKESGLAVAQGFRIGDAAGVSLPHGSNLELMGVTGTLPDSDKPIRYHDEQIARAVLAHFLNLGGEANTGSWALGSTFANFFTDSLNAVADHLADVTQQHVVEDLVDVNWGPNEPAPRLVCEPIGAELPATAEAIRALVDSGALTRDPGLEAHVRDQYGLPVLDARFVPPEPAPDVVVEPEDLPGVPAEEEEAS